MYHVLLSAEEIELLKQLLHKKIEMHKGHETRIIENIIKRLEDPECADDYYDAVDY